MTRKLKIEERAVDHHIERRVPMVRLKGKWLKAAGFPAGQHLTLTVIAPGVMELRVVDTAPAVNASQDVAKAWFAEMRAVVERAA